MHDVPNIDMTDSPQIEDAKPVLQKAVELKYDRESGGDAPRVVASGQGHIAEQIMQIAFDRGIKVREDAELVEILSLIDVDSPIPLEAFAAVAEILAHVYQANALAKQRDARMARE